MDSLMYSIDALFGYIVYSYVIEKFGYRGVKFIVKLDMILLTSM
jgi:hypothetical protein